MTFGSKEKTDLNPLGYNPYLENPEKGLSLAASLLKQPAQDKSGVPGLDKMTNACSRLSDPNPENGFATMREIIRLFNMQGRNRLLRNTAIVGFGVGIADRTELHNWRFETRGV